MPHDPLNFVRHGFGAARPYLYGPFELPAFVSAVFAAVEIERHTFTPRKAHVEMQLADSVLIIEAGALQPDAQTTSSSVSVYVPNVDEVYAKALTHGAVSVMPPQDKPYSERSCGFRDIAGNTWWVSTFLP